MWQSQCTWKSIAVSQYAECHSMHWYCDSHKLDKCSDYADFVTVHKPPTHVFVSLVRWQAMNSDTYRTDCRSSSSCFWPRRRTDCRCTRSARMMRSCWWRPCTCLQVKPVSVNVSEWGSEWVKENVCQRIFKMRYLVSLLILFYLDICLQLLRIHQHLVSLSLPHTHIEKQVNKNKKIMEEASEKSTNKQMKATEIKLWEAVKSCLCFWIFGCSLQ